MLFSNFLNFFAVFLEFSITGRIGTHRNDFFLFLFSLFHHLFQPILAWKEAMVVIYNFLNFFAIFWEFSIVCWVGKHRNDFFLFSLFLGLSQPILAWNENFEFFCYFFGIFNSGSGWNPLERFFLFSLFLGLSQPILA